MNIDTLMQQARAQEASDLILVAGTEPGIYVHGRLKMLDGPILLDTELNAMLESFMSPSQQDRLTQAGDADFACTLPEIGRVRVNVHRQRGSLAAAFRFFTTEIRTFEELHLPAKLAELADLPRGLVLVTGATGSGKSTTLAAIIHYMNHNWERHIITLEDPIEFLFSHQRCVIEQREIGKDSPSFAQSLRHVVRQKPDVILVGEMRDQETIATALTASETGHLVLGTLHTNTAAHTIERIIDMFEAAQQAQIRIQLASTLQAVICQTLLPQRDVPGMVPAIEMMIMTPAIRRAIRDQEIHLIPGMIETGHKFGMIPMDRALANLIEAGVVIEAAALAKAIDPEKLSRLIGRPPSQAAFAPKTTASPEPDILLQATTGAAKPWH